MALHIHIISPKDPSALPAPPHVDVRGDRLPRANADAGHVEDDAVQEGKDESERSTRHTGTADGCCPRRDIAKSRRLIWETFL